MRIAEFGESRNPRTHPALSGLPGSMPVRASFPKKSTPVTIEKNRDERGRSGVCVDAVSWERGAPALAPVLRRGIRCKSFRRERLRVQTHIGSASPDPFNTLVDLGIGSSEDGRRPWSVRPGSEGLRTLPSLTTTSDRARLPAELKHINKRRKRNQQGFPQ